ncbi:putative multidrug-efflux transporter/MT1670 [Pigmentiphaga humi]|uniref:Putative multidrug-efflux transporter/MT1670 n=1 Tax=Pigmentiphaga humi TaxID=2478468 RepID=A0A3P4B380_9BURK|nr:MFS transporter [Pigmentiphaga humi]VCU70744.1 putative multidrug-efflux transporter/MT1670 [Pigmentiphaga humi]
MAGVQDTSSAFELITGRNALRSLALGGGVALHAINVYVVTTIMPSVVRSIGGLSYYAWSTTLFVVASILGSAASYRLIERMGPRRAYLAGLALFCAGSVGCASAPAMAWLLAGRTVQGLGGGVLLALSYALIRMVYEPRLWARALAFVSAMWGVATLSGPALGGWFASMGWWRPAFLSLLPLAAVLAWLVGRLVPAGAPASASGGRIPWGKLLLLAGSVLAISVGGLSHELWWNGAGVAAGLALAWAMARLDRDASAPLLPAGAYSARAVLGANYLTMALLVIGLTSEIYVPYFLQVLHAYAPLAAGYLTAVMAGGWTLAALMYAGRTGASAARLVRGGPIVTAVALAALAVLVPYTGGKGWPAAAALVLALTGVGFGIGMCWSHMVTRVFRSAPAGQENLASGSVTTVQLYAIALGAAIAGMVANAAGLAEPGGVEGARSAAVWLFGSFALIPAVAVWSARAAAR